MWALQRASVRLRYQGLCSGTTQILCVKSEIARYYLENLNSGVIEIQGKQSNELSHSARFYNISSCSSKLYVGTQNLLTQAGARSNNWLDGLEDSFLENRNTSGREAASGDEIDNESFSESELLGENAMGDTHNDLESLFTETGGSEKRSPKGTANGMTKAVLGASASTVGKAMDEWVKEGNEVTQDEVSVTMIHLRKRRMFFKALQLSEWLESTKHLDFLERNYASRVDLISKVHGVYAAEKYIQKLPESFRGKIVYNALLANCVSFRDVKKSEEVFNKMKELFSVTDFACNQLLLLYKRTDKKKVFDVLKLMKKENIKSSVFTYQILIDLKRLVLDIDGMEQLVKRMKLEGLELNSSIQASLALGYALSGLKDKAEGILKELEGNDLKKERWLCRLLLPIYAALGREDEIDRIWQICKSNPRLEECMAAIESWGKVNRIEDAEQAFDILARKLKGPAAKHYAALLNVYVDHKMLEKGKELVKQMVERSNPPNTFTWDVLVKLHIAAGEVKKAGSILEKAIKQKKEKPLFITYVAVLDQYANSGDIHSAEEMLHKIRQAGYNLLSRPYKSLLIAYIKAKAPAYGFNERLKGDKVVVTPKLASLLDRANGLRKSALDELLE